MLYKFRSFNKFGLQIITNHEIYFSSPEELNDPLECRFKSSTVIKELQHRLSGDDLATFKRILRKQYNEKETGDSVPIFQAIEKRSKQAGILSLSRANDDPLMWSHYADGHRGFCIGFRRSYFEDLIENSYQQFSIVGGANVDYSASPKYFDIIIDFIRDYHNDTSFDTFINNLLISIVNTKSDKWEYETEYRMVRFSKGLLKIPVSEIKEIIMGQKASPADKTMLFSILDNASLKHIDKKVANFVPNSFSMKINNL